MGVHVDSVKQPIKRDSVGSGHVSHHWTSSFDDHLDHCLVVFKKCTTVLYTEKKKLRLWSHNLDLTTDQRSGYLPTSILRFMCLLQFPATP